MTKMMSLALGVGVLTFAATGCSDEADIGIDTQPVACLPNGGGEVHGSVSNGGYHHDFGAVTTQLFQDPDSGAAMVQLADSELFLRIGFQCGPAELESYDVVPGTTQQLACPYQVTGSIVGQIEYLGASDGVVIVDQNVNCLAGRFNVDLGDAGELTGWFSTPWQ
jgi:hypothetical protein